MSKQYNLSVDQESFLSRSFSQVGNQDGMQASIEFISSAISQVARKICLKTPDCPEQRVAIERLRDAEHWFIECIKKHGDF